MRHTRPESNRRKRPANFRLTPQAIALLAELAKRRGISRAAVLELLIRKEAKAEKLSVSEGIEK
jgi:hypothetical protein